MRRFTFQFMQLLLVAAPALAAAKPVATQIFDAQYIVLEQQADGSTRPVYTKNVRLHAPLGSLFAAELQARLSAPSRDRARVVVTVRDRAGAVVFRTAAAAAKWRRGEFLKASPGDTTDSNIDSHLLPLPHALYVVRVPIVQGATLTITPHPGGPRTRFKLDALAAEARDARAVVPAVTPVWSNGDPANRVDLLILGDGYTSAEQSKFDDDVSRIVDSFFSRTPYQEYRNYVNVQTLFVPSAQSGADHPPYSSTCQVTEERVQTCCGDPAASGESGGFVDTAFDATYCSCNIARELTVDDMKVLAAAAAAPDWDAIIVLVNDPVYGGSGGPIGVVSTDISAVDIAQHEYGHSFTLLADEYDSPYPGYPLCSDIDESLPLCEPNVTDQNARSLIKWNRWIDMSVPIPTINPLPIETAAGLWAGARYLNSMYRQGYDCMMRALGRPFCDVAAEAYAVRLYSGGWGIPESGIDTIEPGSETPPPGAVTIPTTGMMFSADLLGPADGPALNVTWSLDGAVVASSAQMNGTTASYNLTLPPGVYSLKLEVIDTSPIIHDTVRASLAHSRLWTVTVLQPTTTVTPTPTTSQTPTRTRTPTATPTSTVTRTATRTPTRTATNTPTRTPTSTPTNTATRTATRTPTRTASSTVTRTRTLTQTPRFTTPSTPTTTPTRTPSSSATPTPTATVRFTISGAIHYYSNALAVPGVTVQLNGTGANGAQTDVNGQFVASGLPPGAWQVVPQKTGDFGFALSALDAVYVLQAVVGQRLLTPAQQLACDTSGNGAVTALDAVLMLQHVVGSISSFPVALMCGSDWAFVPIPTPISGETLMSPQISSASCQPGSIAFGPLASDAANQDFTAVLLGDCSGNWESLGSGTAASALIEAPRLQLGAMRRSRGSRVRVPLVVSTALPFHSLDVGVAYDPNQLRFVKMGPVDPQQAIIAVNTETAGIVHVAIASAAPILRDRGVFALEFDRMQRLRTVNAPHLVFGRLDSRVAEVE
jgi:hypothetical protein